MHIFPTILCGGSGSRLWPVSRQEHPKLFIRLHDGQSLLQKAFLRGAGLDDVDEIIAVTNRELLFKVQDEVQEINEADLSLTLILEPFGKNTAPAVATAALDICARYGRDAVLLVLAADHIISDQHGFSKAVAQAAELAQAGKLVTFGITPNAPETGYGYIEAEGSQVLRFVEKPSKSVAEKYIRSGKFLWNSGMFCFTAGTIIDEMHRLCPDMCNHVEVCLKKSRHTIGKGMHQIQLDHDSFAEVEEDSIDYAVMEKSSNVAVVPCDIGWNDIGSWNALSDLTAPDEFGNHVEGDVLLHNTRNCHVQSHDRLIGTVGVENLIVVDTPDALLVANRDCAQDVKHLYASLKAQGHEAYKLHRTVDRPWGSYTVLEVGEQFKIKRIVVKPKSCLSLQLHHHRSEHWVVLHGTARVINGGDPFYVQANESTFIPAGHKHRLENPGDEDLVIIEVQTGNYVGEDDIVRLEDNYGRC